MPHTAKHIQVSSVFLEVIDIASPPPESLPYTWESDAPDVMAFEAAGDGLSATATLTDVSGAGTINVSDQSDAVVASASFEYDKAAGTFSIAPNTP